MKKKYLYNLLLSFVNIFFPILSFPYAAHILGPVGIGKAQFIISFAQYFTLLAAIGIPIYGVKETAKFRDDPQQLSRVFTELSSIFFITSLIFSLIYFLIITLFPFFLSNIKMYEYAGILIIFSFSYTDWFYSGIDAFKAIALRSVLIKLISLILLYLLVKTVNDLVSYFCITLFSILGNQVLSLIMVFKKTSLNFKGLQFKRHLKPLIYIFSATIAASIYTVLDTVLLGFLSDEKAVGLYTASVKLIKITLPVITSMGVILIPSISNKLANKRTKEANLLLLKYYDFLVFISIPIAAGLAILAPEFILLFSGSKFIEATSSMQILSLLPVLIGLGHYFSFQILIPSGRNREIFLSMMTGVVVCLALNFILVPLYREKGAALANIATELVVTLTYFSFIRNAYSFRYNVRLISQTLFSIIPFVPLVLLVRLFTSKPLFVLLFSIPGCTCLYIIVQSLLFHNKLILGIFESFKQKIKSVVQ